MDTIFDYKPTSDELAEMPADYSHYSLEAYLADLKRRADHFNSSEEYEATCDLQQLFQIRNDLGQVKTYGDILETKFKDINDRIFNE